MPKAESDLLRHRVADILVLSPEKTYDICYVIFLNKTSQIKWDTLSVDSSFRFKIPLPCLLCLATASLDLEPGLINMKKKYTTG